MRSRVPQRKHNQTETKPKKIDFYSHYLGVQAQVCYLSGRAAT